MVNLEAESIRELKGAAVSVLLLLGLCHAPVNKRWLECMSGYSDKPVKQACDDLRKLGLVTKDRSGWFLVDNQDLEFDDRFAPDPLVMDEEPDDEIEEEPEDEPYVQKVRKISEPELKNRENFNQDRPSGGESKDPFTQQIRKNSEPVGKNRKNSDSPGQTGRKLRGKRSGKSRKNSEFTQKNRKNSDSRDSDIKDFKDLKELTTSSTPDPFNYIKSSSNNIKKGRKFSDTELEEILKIFNQSSIGLNSRTKAMLALPHVTVDYIKAKTAEYQSRGKGGPAWAGLLITTIEQAEPAPAREFNGHIHGCECTSCKVNRFLGKGAKC